MTNATDDFQARVLAAQDLQDRVRDTRQRLTIDGAGHIVLYHSTSETAAQAILNGGEFLGQSFFAPSARATIPHAKPKHGSGTTTLRLLVDPRDVDFSSGAGEFCSPTKLLRGEDGVWRSVERPPAAPLGPDATPARAPRPGCTRP